MKAEFHVIPGSVTAPQGFRAAGVFCDIKKIGTGKGSQKGRKRDLALIVSDSPCVAAGMFTTNQAAAAPVKVSLEHIREGMAQALVVNSGNANACTGNRGLRDARTMSRLAAAALGIAPEAVLVASTGRIGVPLPMDRVQAGIKAAAQCLAGTRESAAQVAEAIMTSDTRAKEIAVELVLGGVPVRIGGMCKGAGMIHPGMSPTGARPATLPLHATMLSFITTDARVEKSVLDRALANAVALSFNRITVDGDMSTNDTVILLANAAANNPLLRRPDRLEIPRFEAALSHVCLELAKMIVRDGEGVSRFVTLRLSGARTMAEADAAVRAVANSALVKTSWCGGDPNWGRVLDALGYSSAFVAPEKVSVGYSLPGQRKILFALKNGSPTRTPLSVIREVTECAEFDLHIELNAGRAATLLYAADLTEEYVDFNKGE